jgi:hypothetical protein
VSYPDDSIALPLRSKLDAMTKKHVIANAMKQSSNNISFSSIENKSSIILKFFYIINGRLPRDSLNRSQRHFFIRSFDFAAPSTMLRAEGYFHSG